MYCIKCSAPNDDASRFCIKCGHALVTVRSQAAGSKAAPQSSPARLPKRADSITRPKPIPEQDRQGRKDDREDLRPRTAWPYVAAGLSLLAGVVLAAAAYLQIESGDDITMIIGFWNAFVTLAYVWLQIRLILRQEGAYKMGLSLSLGNVGFVMAQGLFWSVAEEFGVYVGEELLIVLGSFLVTDLLLFGGLLLSFRSLVHPLRPADVPDSSLLMDEMSGAPDTTRAEQKLLLHIRRLFIVHMHDRLRGSIEINDLHGGQHVDLVAKPLISYLGSVFGGEGPKRYAFHAVLDREQVKAAKGLIDFIVTISASDDALRESAKGLTKVGVYVLRGGFRTSKKASDFAKFARSELGLTFFWQRQ